jgi:hypothetical protein
MDWIRVIAKLKQGSQEMSRRSDSKSRLLWIACTVLTGASCSVAETGETATTANTGPLLVEQVACSQWQVQYYVFAENCDDDPCNVPVGWEPFGALDSEYRIWIRRCVY